MLIGRGSAAASGAVMQNGRLPMVLPPANFRKPSGLWEGARGRTCGRASARGYELVASWATGRRGGAEGAVSESPYVVSYMVLLRAGAVGGFDASWPGFRRRLRGGETKWQATGGVTTGLFP